MSQFDTTNIWRTIVYLLTQEKIQHSAAKCPSQKRLISQQLQSMNIIQQARSLVASSSSLLDIIRENHLKTVFFFFLLFQKTVRSIIVRTPHTRKDSHQHYFPSDFTPHPAKVNITISISFFYFMKFATTNNEPVSHSLLDRAACWQNLLHNKKDLICSI